MGVPTLKDAYELFPNDTPDPVDQGFGDEPQEVPDGLPDEVPQEVPEGLPEGMQQPPAEEEPKGAPRKRTYLKDLTPRSKEVELERRKQVKRDNSRLWHQTYHSKGVLKTDEGEGGEEPEEPPQEPPQEPLQEPAGLPQDEFKPDQELMDFAVDNDMRKARFKFMYTHGWNGRAPMAGGSLSPPVKGSLSPKGHFRPSGVTFAPQGSLSPPLKGSLAPPAFWL